MKKVLIVLQFAIFLMVPSSAFPMQTTVDITGPQELSSLKEGIEKSVTARCIAKGIAVDKYNKLTITISRLGDIISYDALLDTKPARAFHKDIKDVSSLSATMDEMIDSLFLETGKAPVTPILQKNEPLSGETAPEIKLPLKAISIASLGDKIFICDTKTVYELKGDKTTPLWQAPGNNEILRLFPYGESIIVLTKIMNDCRSFMISGTEAKERWNKAVIPLGNGLISTNLTFDKWFGKTPYAWSKASQVKGSSPQIPDGLDIISAVPFEAKSSSSPGMIISYNRADAMAVSDGKSMVWIDDTRVGNSPQFIEDIREERDYTGSESVSRYYLKPRIVLLDDTFVTLRNNQGSTKIVPGFNMFEHAQVLAYSTQGNGFTRRELASFPDGYCTDITAIQGKIAALIVKGNYTYVQLLGL